MSIQERIDQDLKQAMASREETRTSTLRFLKSALKYAAIEKRSDVLPDAEAFAVLQKQIKQRRESIEQFSSNGRDDLAAKERAELAVLEAYLPSQLSDEELEAAIRETAASLGASSKKDFGRVMKALTDRLAGRADAKRISERLGKILPS